VPIALVKTHKTGGSTLANILFRLAGAQNSSVMMPSCKEPHKLGYPLAFPGENAQRLHEGSLFDMILNHAVFNATAFASFLKPSPFFVSILRQPESQLRSTFNFFDKWTSIDDFVRMLDAGRHEQPVYHYVNFQANDLGFYEAGGRPNSSSEEVKSWIAALKQSFEFPRGLMMITEFFDEGLVLLKHRLNLDLPAVTYIEMKKHEGAYEEFNATTLEWLRAHAANIDLQLYRHFNESFQELWAGHVSEDLAALRRANARMAEACAETDCPEEMTIDAGWNISYANRFRRRQGLAVCDPSRRRRAVLDE